MDDSSLKSYSIRLAGNPVDAEDARSELIMVLCEMGKEKRERIQDYFHFWCVRTLRNITLDMKRGRGRMAKYHQKKLEVEEMLMAQFTDHQEEKVSDIRNALESLYWYDRELFITYLEEGSCRAVEKITGISYTSVALTVKDVKERISWALK